MLSSRARRLPGRGLRTADVTLLRPFDLLVTVLAVGADRRSVRRLVGIVVTPETADRCDVPFIVRIPAPRHLHRRKHVAAVNVLGCRDALRHGVLILGLGFPAGLVEASKPLVDRLQGAILAGV